MQAIVNIVEKQEEQILYRTNAVKHWDMIQVGQEEDSINVDTRRPTQYHYEIYHRDKSRSREYVLRLSCPGKSYCLKYNYATGACRVIIIMF